LIILSWLVVEVAGMMEGVVLAQEDSALGQD
jgi:hypothetical protein